MSWQYPYPLFHQGTDFVIVWIDWWVPEEPRTRRPVAVPQTRKARREFERMQVNAMAANSAVTRFYNRGTVYGLDVDGQPGPRTLLVVRYVAELMVTALAAVHVGEPPWYNAVTNKRYVSELDATVTMAAYAETIAADFGLFNYRLREAVRS